MAKKKLTIHSIQENCIQQVNSFPTNVPPMYKPGSWFLLAKRHPSTGVCQTFC